MPAGAYDLKPIVMQLQPTGARAAQTAVITNTHAVPIAIEVKAFRRKQNADGTDTRTPDDDNVIISPPQMVIAPKASQSFRIQWVGENNPSKELAYRIVTEQLPIEFKKESRNNLTADLTMRYQYQAALYILPKDRIAQATLTSVTRIDGPDGNEQLELRIRSDGNSRAILEKPALELSADGRSLKLEGEAIRPLIGLNILPGNERVVRIPVPAEFKGRAVTGKLSTQYLTLN